MILTLSVYAALATLLPTAWVCARLYCARDVRPQVGRQSTAQVDPLPPRTHKAAANAGALKRLSCAFRCDGEFAKIDRELIWLSRS